MEAIKNGWVVKGTVQELAQFVKIVPDKQQELKAPRQVRQSRKYKRWAKEEDTELVKLYQAGKSYKYIKGQLKRSSAAVRVRLNVLKKTADLKFEGNAKKNKELAV